MLQETFLELIGKYSDDNAFHTNCWNELANHYNSKNRYYPNLQHLANMLQELIPIKQKVQKLDSFLFSIYYHDVVYQATRSDNEYQSALLFKKRIAQTNFSNIEHCFQQIEATKTHEPSEDHDTNILLDIDLSILGQDQNTYQEYTQQIRQEYRIYPNFLYQKGRRKVLIKMLAQDKIYKTHYFINKYEAQARDNIKQELEQLS